MKQLVDALVLRSELLSAAGLVHGFSLRTGGVSEGAFATLNLAFNEGTCDRVAENRERFARAVGYGPSQLYELSQVHGAHVYALRSDDQPESVRKLEGDALVSQQPGCAVGVRTADCVPLLLANVASGAVAAVHAGWRGIVARVIGAALRELCPTPREREQCVAALGPHIGVCCFMVGADVANMISQASQSDHVAQRRGEHCYVSLADAARLQLVAEGLSAQRIEQLEGCTYCDRERFFSYRRDGAQSGRHLAVIIAPRA